MKFKAEIDVMPLDALLDPQGKAVVKSLKNIGLAEVEDVRIGRHIQLIIEAASEKTAIEKVEQACQKLLSNQVMERYSYAVSEI